MFACYSYGFDAHAVSHHPLFMPDGSVIATRVIAKKFNLLSPVVMFERFFIQPDITDADSTPKAMGSVLEINSLEYRILFMLLLGMTQQEMSFFVEVSRSRLAQIQLALYARFKVSNQEELIEYVLKNKLVTKIPPQFVHPKVIELNNGEAKIFQG